MPSSRRSGFGTIAVTASLSLSTLFAVPLRLSAAPPSEEDLGKLALAEEFAGAGVKAVSIPKIEPANVRQSAALLRAACDECAFEPRFPRLLAEACVQLKDDDGAIAALERYRAIQLPEVQNDQFAEVELIDLATNKAQTLEDKLAYLRPLLGVAQLPDPVKSHIAVVCSKLLQQKFDKQGSESMLAQALQLNPLSPEALQLAYEAAKASGDPVRQAAVLVGLLKSNPAQPLVMGTLADDLASVGQPDLAVNWYKRSFSLSQQLNLSLDPGRYLNYAAALYAMDQPRLADEASTMLLAGQPSNIGAATIQLLDARQAAKQMSGADANADPLQHAREAALAALSAQMGTLHALLHGVTGAATTQASTTQPADLIGDIVADAPHVRDIQKRPDLNRAQSEFCTGYAAALADLIFYYSYFDPQPATANKLLDSLRLIRPADDTELTRLEGFTFLADGKRDEAKVKFSAVADHDPLSEMGLLLMAPVGPETTAQATKLVTDHPAGLLGAILLDGLRDKGAKPSATPDSTAVANEAAGFPMKMLDLLNPDDTQSFYNLVADPLHVSRGFDEPALVRVTIKNIGEYDLSVGPDAAIRPDLWFDVAVQGGNNPTFHGVAYDRIAGPLVLKAHHLDQPGTNQVVRVDTGPLGGFLSAHPTIAVSMLFSVFTNPIGEQVGVAPGPGGYRQQFSSPMERRASPVMTSADLGHLFDPVFNGRIDEKIHTLELLADYVLVMKARIAQLEKAVNTPAGAAPATPPASDAPVAGDDVGAGELPPPVGSAPPAPPDPKQAQASILHMQDLIVTFTSTIRATLRDPSSLVRYWAQAKLGQIGDPATRQQTALMMVKGKDWEQRLLGLMLATDLPPAQGKAIASALTADSNNDVKDLANATVEIANLPPATRPASKS